MATPQMPDPPVPTSRLDPRYSPDASREECMVDIDFGPETLLDAKMYDSAEPIPGGAGDGTGISAQIILNDNRRDREDPAAS